MKLTYLGTATVLLEVEGMRLLTDPAFDPAGTAYDFGPWYAPRAWFSSQKQYQTPMGNSEVGPVDAVLLSHDHHADNLDHEGRRLIAGPTVARVITTRAGAARLAGAAPPGRPSVPGEGLGIGAKTTGLAWGETTQLGSGAGALRLTATPARHGPVGTPQIHEVMGLLIEPESPSAPTVWISGDTVLFPALRQFLTNQRASGRRIDVAIIHCGGVSFPKFPVLGRSRFTFDAKQVAEVYSLLEPRMVIPVHRSGWTHFRESEQQLRATLEEAGLTKHCRFLELGESTTLTAA
ncbi:MBL fold metallo-hydrolase [Stigmatella sp. ncwal1]|uniref:MBL fold metallo-hydrolase n=1 Tax=Stigmatella ashevillensis TaxID=2995309 RepID=A0ABT5D8M7_9BACT|nr:MBL fold metallo-hydrolase [Stigmatella ashevillena]MDC0710021.1 MBL fold metallo-hydrolase [Stigmatella ashevillena]